MSQAPAIDGWFTTGDDPRLIGSKCAACGTFAFPKVTSFCRNPACASTDLEEVLLSSHGTLWSYTVNHYPPPPPATSPDPFEPYGVAAVELGAEKMIVLGMLSGPLDGLAVGDAMMLVVEPLPGADELVWKWRKA